jgi:oxygen-independent coproporphyrinogen-3 oxidase
VPEFIKALETELNIRKYYLNQETIESIYLGGGTPSLLSSGQIFYIIEKIRQLHQVSPDCEITLEANPDDLTTLYLQQLIAHSGINRISIGIQSFHDKDLRLLNRRHNSSQAHKSIEFATDAGFNNISIDLIYGIPGMDNRKWQKNLDLALSYKIQHLSAYHLSIEPGTPFSQMVSKGELKLPDEEESYNQFYILRKMASEKEFIHYEISNLAKKGYFSRHNTGYWQQKKYLGIGPSAHSYDIHSRQWNMPHVKKYIDALNQGSAFYSREELDDGKRYNEYLLVSLRTSEGADLERIRQEFGESACNEFVLAAGSLKSSGHMIQEGGMYRLTERGWLISDYIISRLMKEENQKKPPGISIPEVP